MDRTTCSSRAMGCRPRLGSWANIGVSVRTRREYWASVSQQYNGSQQIGVQYVGQGKVKVWEQYKSSQLAIISRIALLQGTSLDHISSIAEVDNNKSRQHVSYCGNTFAMLRFQLHIGIGCSVIKLLLMYTIRHYLQQRSSHLPSIPQCHKHSPNNDNKHTTILHLSNKSIIPSHRRAKTLQLDHLPMRTTKSTRSKQQQMRMRPMLKYDHRLSNLRLAQKLLMVRPSRDTDRSGQKRFYLQQRYYRQQISRSYHYVKSCREGKGRAV